MCTAFCVTPDIVLTAAHCLFGTNAAPNDNLRRLSFRLGNGRPVPVAGRSTATEAVNVVVGTRGLSVTPPIDAGADWAAVRLARPACHAHRLPVTQLQPRKLEQKAPLPVAMIAIHRDLPDWHLRSSDGCTLTSRLLPRFSKDFATRATPLFHDCDTGVGSSGAPIINWVRGRAEVVAMNVGTYVVTKTLVATNGTPTRQPRAIANTAVAAAAFIDAPTRLIADAVPDRLADMIALQRALRERGLYVGLTTGRMNAALAHAIRRWQRSLDRAETGLPYPGMLVELSAARAAADRASSLAVAVSRPR